MIDHRLPHSSHCTTWGKYWDLSLPQGCDRIVTFMGAIFIYRIVISTETDSVVVNGSFGALHKRPLAGGLHLWTPKWLLLVSVPCFVRTAHLWYITCICMQHYVVSAPNRASLSVLHARNLVCHLHTTAAKNASKGTGKSTKRCVPFFQNLRAMIYFLWFGTRLAWALSQAVISRNQLHKLVAKVKKTQQVIEATAKPWVAVSQRCTQHQDNRMSILSLVLRPTLNLVFLFWP